VFANVFRRSIVSAAPSVASPSRVTPLTRVLVAVTGLAALAGAVVLIGPWAFALWLAPDVALLAGWQRGFAKDGRLAPRAVPIYNALHAIPGPAAIALTGAAAASPLVAGLGVLWLSHVLIDRAMGYGLRTPEGEQRG
jgi:hypothetical protein